jgi:hypothetical protein
LIRISSARAFHPEGCHPSDLLQALILYFFKSVLAGFTRNECRPNPNSGQIIDTIRPLRKSSKNKLMSSDATASNAYHAVGGRLAWPIDPPAPDFSTCSRILTSIVQAIARNRH